MAAGLEVKIGTLVGTPNKAGHNRHSGWTSLTLSLCWRP